MIFLLLLEAEVALIFKKCWSLEKKQIVAARMQMFGIRSYICDI